MNSMSMTSKIHADNIKCEGCANSIVQGLSKLDGVEDVHVDVTTSMITIDHRSEEDLHSIKSKLAQLGYPEFGKSGLGHKAKSFVSCAIGRL